MGNCRKTIGNYRKINGVPFDCYHPRADAPMMRYDGERLEDCYAKPSDNKRRAFKQCRDWYMLLGGSCFTISSHNCMTFCVMFDFIHPETGEFMRAHITPAHNHLYHL